MYTLRIMIYGNHHDSVAQAKAICITIVKNKRPLINKHGVKVHFKVEYTESIACHCVLMRNLCDKGFSCR